MRTSQVYVVWGFFVVVVGGGPGNLEKHFFPGLK